MNVFKQILLAFCIGSGIFSVLLGIVALGLAFPIVAIMITALAFILASTFIGLLFIAMWQDND